MKATRIRHADPASEPLRGNFLPTPDSWPSDSRIAMATDAIFCNPEQHGKYLENNLGTLIACEP